MYGIIIACDKAMHLDQWNSKLFLNFFFIKYCINKFNIGIECEIYWVTLNITCAYFSSNYVHS